MYDSAHCDALVNFIPSNKIATCSDAIFNVGTATYINLVIIHLSCLNLAGLVDGAQTCTAS